MKMVPAFDLSGDPGSLEAKLLTVDVDGEGHRDLVLVSPKSGLAVVLWSAASGITVSKAAPALTISYADLEEVCARRPHHPDRMPTMPAPLRPAPPAPMARTRA